MAGTEAGWLVVPELVTTAECNEIIQACEDLCTGDPAALHHRDKPVAGTRHLEELATRIPLVGVVVERPALVDAVAAWFGGAIGPAKLSQASLRAPAAGHGEQDLHRDAMEGPPVAVASVVTAIVPLVDMTTNNGATRVVPGSHRTGEPAQGYRGRGRHQDEVQLIGPAGTAFVFTGHLLHAGGQNASASPRPVLQLVWR